MFRPILISSSTQLVLCKWSSNVSLHKPAGILPDLKDSVQRCVEAKASHMIDNKWPRLHCGCPKSIWGSIPWGKQTCIEDCLIILFKHTQHSAFLFLLCVDEAFYSTLSPALHWKMLFFDRSWGRYTLTYLQSKMQPPGGSQFGHMAALLSKQHSMRSDSEWHMTGKRCGRIQAE